MLAKAENLFLALLAAAPTSLACEAYADGLPTATENVALSEPIYVKAGEVYDGGWRKFDRNPTSCNDQSEGGTSISTSFTGCILEVWTLMPNVT